MRAYVCVQQVKASTQIWYYFFAFKRIIFANVINKIFTSNLTWYTYTHKICITFYECQVVISLMPPYRLRLLITHFFPSYLVCRMFFHAIYIFVNWMYIDFVLLVFFVAASLLKSVYAICLLKKKTKTKTRLKDWKIAKPQQIMNDVKSKIASRTNDCTLNGWIIRKKNTSQTSTKKKKHPHISSNR